MLHMGRTSLKNEGLRQFKLGWGAEGKHIEYYQIRCRDGDMVNIPATVSGFHNAVFSEFPLLVNRLMGSLIYPHLD